MFFTALILCFAALLSPAAARPHLQERATTGLIPSLLQKRDPLPPTFNRASAADGCPVGWAECSATTCYPLDGAQCCSDGNFCLAGTYCDDGGCCPDGEICSGTAPPPSTITVNPGTSTVTSTRHTTVHFTSTPTFTTSSFAFSTSTSTSTTANTIATFTTVDTETDTFDLPTDSFTLPTGTATNTSTSAASTATNPTSGNDGSNSTANPLGSSGSGVLGLPIPGMAALLVAGLGAGMVFM